MICHMLDVQLMVPYLSQTDVDCLVNMAYDTNMYGVPFYFLFPIMDIQNSFLDIHN